MRYMKLHIHVHDTCGTCVHVLHTYIHILYIHYIKRYIQSDTYVHTNMLQEEIYGTHMYCCFRFYVHICKEDLDEKSNPPTVGR